MVIPGILSNKNNLTITSKVIMKIIDLRSDTVTKPTPAMLQAMTTAKLGDDVFGDDPTTIELEEHAAHLLGKQAALLVPSGTQGNLISLMTHCQRGDEYIVGQNAHAYCWEAGGAAVLGSIQPQPIDMEIDGTLDLAKVTAQIKPDDSHFARTKLLCIENTHYGKVLPMTYINQISNFCKQHNLASHLDGARVFNAAVKLQLPVHEITKHFDSISFCLSKGLGAPIGSVVCGTKDFIAQARRWRKMVGGGMRQTGIIAAAGLYALKHHVERLADDHAHAEILANSLHSIGQLQVEYESTYTNMVFVTIPEQSIQPLHAFLQTQGIIILPGKTLRLVSHLDVSRQDIDSILKAFQDFFRNTNINHETTTKNKSSFNYTGQ